jgi:hypothetical protein
VRPFHNSIEAIVGNDIVRVAIQGDANGFDYDTDLIAVAAINSLTAMELFELLESSFTIDIKRRPRKSGELPAPRFSRMS